MNAVGASVWTRLLTWLDHAPPEDGYWRLKARPSRDESASLTTLLEGHGAKAEADFRRIAHRIRASRILFVPALFGGVAMTASRLKLVDYLTEQVRHLRDEGFDAEIAEVDTADRVERNGEHLARIVEAHHRPTWVITHSKGGLDFLHALMLRPDLTRFIDGWIAFQAPFWGSPVADVACGSARAGRISGRALKLVGRNLDLIADLRTDQRAAYMDQRIVQVSAIARDVPVMCVATTSGNALNRSWRPVWPTGRWMDGLELKNDGLVPVTSAILPSSRYVVLDGLVHGEVAARRVWSNRKYDHVDLLKALFALTLRDPSAPRMAAA